MARMGREDWAALGLAALREGGAGAIRLEAVTERAGKTRGSFYHHFESHDAFVAAMLALWRERQTEAPIAEADAAPDPAAALNALAARLDLALERAVRRLAAEREDWAAEVAAVDAARIDRLRKLRPDPEGAAARDYATLEYAAFVGLAELAPDAPPERLEALGRLMDEMIEAHWNE
ncbi:MAG: TetR family transcriptional regulator [Pseudomonadota bacterium]